MSRGMLQLVFDFTSLYFLLLVLVSFQFVGCITARDLDHECAPSSCGKISNISYPFRLKDDPQRCGKEKYELSCEDNVAVLYLYAGRYYVQEIDYKNFTIRVVASGLQTDNCSSLPSRSLSDYNFRSGDPYNTYIEYKYIRSLSMSIVFVSCAKPVSSSIYVDATPCLNGTITSGSNLSSYHYVMVGHYTLLEMENSCRVELMAMMASSSVGGVESDEKNVSYKHIHSQLTYGFELTWIDVLCNCNARRSCYFDEDLQPQCYGFLFSQDWLMLASLLIYPGKRILWMRLFVLIISAMLILCNFPTAMYLAARFFLCGVPCFAILLVCKWRRRHLSAYDSVEDFLRSHNNLMPIRYAYSDIKRMTKGFKDKLGEGGFGSVYKAKLRSGHIVAIKVLSAAKGNGQDFINEVGTIGRIHHVNVVKLIGYCAERSKRALVYEFMPNGSLEKYIFQKGEGMSLSCNQMYEIALGVARGIEYLHRGCNIQILHFDIKPHNILLDENFTPKVSDFGLAKLYPTGKDIVTLTAARGTMGYMAPELFYENIGGVSYKADVYSFGMLLMEMAGRRKNLNAFAEHTSQIYFPSWIYDKLVQNREIGAMLGDGLAEEVEMVKKMVIVGLWCIQMKPEDRPSMNRVLEMLEGEVDSLELPAKNPVDDSRFDLLNRVGGSEMEVDGTTSSSSLIITTN